MPFSEIDDLSFAGYGAASPSGAARDAAPVGGRRSRRSHKGRTLKAKTLRRLLKKKGMKTTGKKATLMKRLHLRGGAEGTDGDVEQAASGSSANPGAGYAGQIEDGLATGGRRRRSRRRE